VTALRDEIVAFLAAGAAFALPQSRVVDQRFPLLTEHWAHVYVSSEPLANGLVDVGTGANSFAPDGLVGITLERLQQKQARAVGYDSTRPLWLGLFITDQRGLFDETLLALRQLVPPIAPYELVAVYYEGDVVVWAGGQPPQFHGAPRTS
jgi:hypothetical protein